MLRAVSDALPVCVAYIGADRRYRFVNRAYARQVALPPEQVLGREVRDIVDARTYEELRPYLEKALSGRESTLETLVRRADGRNSWFSILLVPDLDQKKAKP